MFVSGCFEFPPFGLMLTVKLLHSQSDCRFPKANTLKVDIIFAIANAKGFRYAQAWKYTPLYE